MADGIQFDSEGGFRYTGANGEQRHVPAEPLPNRVVTIGELARLYDNYGFTFTAYVTQQEQIHQGMATTPWNYIDRGNLIRSAIAAENAAAWAQRCQVFLARTEGAVATISIGLRAVRQEIADVADVAQRFQKLIPRLERVLKLFETVLKPVADQVKEREECKGED
jgi:hypothetical protein